MRNKNKIILKQLEKNGSFDLLKDLSIQDIISSSMEENIKKALIYYIEKNHPFKYIEYLESKGIIISNVVEEDTKSYPLYIWNSGNKMVDCSYNQKNIDIIQLEIKQNQPYLQIDSNIMWYSNVPYYVRNDIFYSSYNTGRKISKKEYYELWREYQNKLSPDHIIDLTKPNERKAEQEKKVEEINTITQSRKPEIQWKPVSFEKDNQGNIINVKVNNPESKPSSSGKQMLLERK